MKETKGRNGKSPLVESKRHRIVGARLTCWLGGRAVFTTIYALIAVILNVGVWQSTALASWECRKPIAPNEVRVFERQDLIGDCQSFFLHAGMRHRLVPNLDKRWYRKISSIWIGPKVSVMFFEQPGFRGFFGYRKTDSPQARNLTVPDATSASHGLWDDRIASLIVFRRDTSVEGVFLHPIGGSWQNTQFFPLPEPANQLTGVFPVLPPHLLKRVESVNVLGGPALVAELYEDPYFKGKSIILPPPGMKKNYMATPLKPYGFHGRPASLKVIQTAVRAKPIPPRGIQPRPGVISPK